MPATATRNALLEAIAARRGQPMLAFEYAFAAPDIAGVQAQIETLKARDPRRAYVLEERFRDRLVALSTHPDAVAHAWWMLGTIASAVGGRSWLELAYADYATAAALAPLDLTNVLGAANQAVTLHDWAHAEHWYRHAIDVNPATADGIAGLGIVALNARADRRAAQRYLAQARTADPSAPLVRELQRELALP
jgi:hypothetical protein